MSEHAVSADGLLINYELRGEGLPALVFVHGWCCDHSYWQKQIDHFSSQYTVVAIDLGGHGDSGLDRDTWTMAAFGRDVVAVVEKLGLRQVVLIGHSMGGTVVVEAAQQIPGRVKAIIGVDTFKNLGQTRTQAQVEVENAPFRKDFRQATDDFVRTGMFVPTSDAALIDKIAKDMAAAPPQVGFDAGVRLDSHDAELQKGLQKLQVPIMSINSDYQPTDDAAERYGISIELMSGTGHFVMLEDPETFNLVLENVLQRLQ